MTDLDGDSLFTARVQWILEQSVAALPEADRAARQAWCQENNAYGVRAHLDDGDLRFTWGGRNLALVEGSAFEEEAYFKPLAMDIVGQTPDNPGELE